MIKKPFTPDNCPLIPGSAIHDSGLNTDILVLYRYLDYDSNKDNSDKPLISVCIGSSVVTFTGDELMCDRWEYYPEWPSTGVTKPCWHEVPEDRELIIDFNDNPEAPDPSGYLKELCNIKTKYIVCQVTNHKSYADNTYYEMTDEFYEWLDDKIQCEDCKNGCQIYKDKDGYYFCITGSNYYDRETDKYKGTDEVHIRIKEYVWH